MGAGLVVIDTHRLFKDFHRRVRRVHASECDQGGGNNDRILFTFDAAFPITDLLFLQRRPSGMTNTAID